MKVKGSIGIFDSGLGGLLIGKAIQRFLPQYSYVYLGDSKNLPYGEKTHNQVYKLTEKGIKYLFEKENCGLVIVACNTASARALRKIQKKYKDRKVLGVLIPAAEEAGRYEVIGVLATNGTVSSQSFPMEIKKINKRAKIFQNPAPALVPLIEKGDIQSCIPYLHKYLLPLLNKNIEALVLGCTHYPILKKEIKKIIGKDIKIISQDEVVPRKLKTYLKKHSEIDSQLSKKKGMKILVTEIKEGAKKFSPRLISL